MFPAPLKLLACAGLCGALALALVGPTDPLLAKLSAAHEAHPAASRAVDPPEPTLLTSPAAKAGLAQQATLRLLIRYKDGVGPAAAAQTESEAGVHLIKSIPDLGIRIVVADSSGKADGAIAALKGRADVDFAERDAVIAPQDNLPNDPSFPTNYDVGGGAWGWTMTHTTQAWDVTRGDSSVVIAILDTGIRTSGLGDFDGQISSTWNVLNGTTDASTNAGNHGTPSASAQVGRRRHRKTSLIVLSLTTDAVKPTIRSIRSHSERAIRPWVWRSCTTRTPPCSSQSRRRTSFMETTFVHSRPGGVALFVPDEMRETFVPSTDHGGCDTEHRSLRKRCRDDQRQLKPMRRSSKSGRRLTAYRSDGPITSSKREPAAFSLASVVSNRHFSNRASAMYSAS